MNNNKAYLIKTDGTVTEVIPNKAGYLSFKESYPLINATTIEPIFCAGGLVMFCDEEGRFNGKRNALASQIFQDGRIPMENEIAILKAQWGEGLIVVHDDDTDMNDIYGDVVVLPETWYK